MPISDWSSDVCSSDLANILMYLGERHDLAPSPMADRFWLNQLQLTVADMIAEVHNVHHPVAAGAYYHEQKDEAARAAEQFREQRMPKFLRHFETSSEEHTSELQSQMHTSSAAF